MSKWICLLVVTVGFTGIAGLPLQKAHAYKRHNRVAKFDAYFNKYTKRFFGPGFDWRFSRHRPGPSHALKQMPAVMWESWV